MYGAMVFYDRGYIEWAHRTIFEPMAHRESVLYAIVYRRRRVRLLDCTETPPYLELGTAQVVARFPRESCKLGYVHADETSGCFRGLAMSEISRLQVSIGRIRKLGADQ